MIFRATAVAAAALLSFSCFAMPDKTQLSKQLQKVIPNGHVDSITAAPIDGLYEITSGSNVLYSTEQGDRIIYGHIIDLSGTEPHSLTEETIKKLRLRAIAAVDEKSMITFPASQPQHVITVFTDIDCTYCRRLHQEVPELNKAGVTVRYLAFPRAGVDSLSFTKAVNVWCAKDRQAAMTEAKSGRTVAASADCNSAATIKRHLQLVEELNLRATPVIISEDGSEFPGYMPAEVLLSRIAASDKKS